MESEINNGKNDFYGVLESLYINSKVYYANQGIFAKENIKKSIFYYY